MPTKRGGCGSRLDHRGRAESFTQCSQHEVLLSISESRLGGGDLLDLVLSDLAPLIKPNPVPGIADHKGILGKLSFPSPDVTLVEREVLIHAKADWKGLRRAICQSHWRHFIVIEDADLSATNFEHELLKLVRRHIPVRELCEEKRDNAWHDDLCKELIAIKRAGFGTDECILLRDKCTAGLLRAYNEFVTRTRDKLLKLKPSSREWWRQSQSLMSLGVAREVIPLLRRPDGSWAKTPLDKANLLADTFSTK